MVKEYDKLDNKIIELYNKGYSKHRISKELGVYPTLIHRRLARLDNQNQYGDNHYYKNKYCLALYEYETKDLVNVFRNVKELERFLDRKYLSQPIAKGIIKYFNKEKNKYYLLKIVSKDEVVSNKYE